MWLNLEFGLDFGLGLGLGFELGLGLGFPCRKWVRIRFRVMFRDCVRVRCLGEV